MVKAVLYALETVDDDPELAPNCTECGAALAPNERREPFVCLECSLIECSFCRRRHSRAFRCPARIERKS